MSLKCDAERVTKLARERIAASASVNREKSCRLGIRRLHDVVMVPIVGYAGLYENGQAVESSYFVRSESIQNELPVESLKNVSTISEPVFYLGKFNVCWGHCITDHFKFLWPFLSLDKHPELSTCKLVYTTLSRSDRLPQNYLHILEAMGIDRSRLVRVDRATILQDCYLADECFSSIRHEEENERRYTREYSKIVDAICRRLAHKGEFPKKIYLSRSGWHARTEFGERYLEKAFVAAGYEIVRPERMPFAEFISMMQQADVVAATECSSSHNALFMRKGATLVLLRKYDRVNSYQMAINQVRELDVHYIDVGHPILFTDRKCRYAGPFFMYVTKQLADFLQVESHFPLLEFIRYISTAVTLKIHHIAYGVCYRVYKRIVVSWLGINRWERGKIT